MGLKLWFSGISVLICLFVITAALAVGQDCDDCHSGSSGSGGYEFLRPLVVLSQPAVCGPGETVKVRLYVISTSVYTITSATANLGMDLQTGTVPGTPSKDPEGVECIEWDVLTGDGPVKGLRAECQYTCQFEHDSPGDKDAATFSGSVRSEMQVVTSNMRSDRDLVIVPASGANVVLRAQGPVSGISVALSPSLMSKVDVSLDRADLMTGQTAILDIASMSEGTLDGHINLSWTETGSRKHTYIRVIRVRPTASKGLDIYHELGKYTGIAAFVLLVVGYFTGGTGPLKDLGNRLFKSVRRRVKFHCALSYEVMVLVIFHMLVLWYGPYRELIWLWEVVLGEVAMLLMVVIAVNGMFQEKLLPLMGYQNWRRIHAWGTYLATGLVVVHMLTNGTHFVWFRQLIGMV